MNGGGGGGGTSLEAGYQSRDCSSAAKVGIRRLRGTEHVFERATKPYVYALHDFASRIRDTYRHGLSSDPFRDPRSARLQRELKRQTRGKARTADHMNGASCPSWAKAKHTYIGADADRGLVDAAASGARLAAIFKGAASRGICSFPGRRTISGAKPVDGQGEWVSLPTYSTHSCHSLTHMEMVY